tara:strand:+ start:2787 stop:3029 length:243 start_codon:yes stop_codon:yes gene_type:complete
MKRSFTNKIILYKKSIEWWRDQSVQLSYEAEELDWMYEMGMLTDEEVVIKTKELNEKMSYLMKKGLFEHENLFKEFTINE